MSNLEDRIPASAIRDPHPVWRYRNGDSGVESRLFSDITDVPKGEGWADSPARLDEKPAARKRAP